MKVKCAECGWCGELDDVLRAENPWDKSPIMGCPKCFAPEQIITACAVDGCTEDATCGWKDGKGAYHQTCGHHMRLQKSA